MEHRYAARFRDAYTAMISGDSQLFIDFLDDHIEWWEAGASQPIRGKARVEARLDQLGEYGISAELHDLFANDEHLVALVHATAKQGDRHLSYSTAEVYHFSEDELIAKRQAFAHDTPPIADFFT